MPGYKLNLTASDVDSSKYFTWENYFTDLLHRITVGTQFSYDLNKSKLSDAFLVRGNMEKILSVYGLECLLSPRRFVSIFELIRSGLFNNLNYSVESILATFGAFTAYSGESALEYLKSAGSYRKRGIKIGKYRAPVALLLSKTFQTWEIRHNLVADIDFLHKEFGHIDSLDVDTALRMLKSKYD